VKNEENIDKLFRDSLQNPEIPFNEEDWQKMSQKLDRVDTKVRPVWLLWASAVAALLVVGLFWMFFPSNPISKARQNTPVARQRQTVEIPNRDKGEVQSSSGVSAAKEKYAGQIAKRSRNEAHRLLPSATPGQLLPLLPKQMPIPFSPQLQPTMIGQVAITSSINLQDHIYVPLNATINTSLAQSKTHILPYTSVEKSIKRKMRSGSTSTQGLVLTALLAPDLSYAQSSIASRVSTNVGLLASYGLTSKLSVSTGAIYSNKFYNSKGSGLDAYGGTGATFQINASCNVLDIPLNVNYKLLQKKAYSVTVNTGLSSYLMLKEKYDYIYPEPGAPASVVSVEVRNQNQHLLGIANLSFMVERKISSHVSIGVQPFMKVPLTGIGLGDASLKSSGMSFSINMSLFRDKKPGKLAGLKRFNP
jgi:hypothetical protein